MHIATLDIARLDDAVDVLSDAFHDYPVMRFIVGEAGADYDRRLRLLVEFFTAARFLSDGVVLGLGEAGGALVGAATITLPGEHDPPPEVAKRRDAMWRELGSDANERYERLVGIWQTFVVEGSHYHLNMLGVRRAMQKRKLSRRLLEAVHGMSERAADSGGVSLTTETPVNVELYQHFGYAVVAHARVTPDLETWGMFRPNQAGRSHASQL